MKLKIIWDLIKDTIWYWHQDKVPRLSAALAYYTIFSLAPLMVISIAIAGMFFGQVTPQILQRVYELVGAESAHKIELMAEEISRPSSSKMAAILGLFILLFGASGLLGELQDGLNTIWNVKSKHQQFWKIIKYRFLSFAMVLAIGFLLLVSLIFSVLLTTFSNYLNNLISSGYVLSMLLSFIISLSAATCLFALIFKTLPDVKIYWQEVWLGAFITGILFTLGKTLIGIYIGNTNLGSVYGAAGSLIIILIWVYYSAQILFFGAEFTKVYSKLRRSYVPPTSFGEPLSKREKHKMKR